MIQTTFLENWLQLINIYIKGKTVLLHLPLPFSAAYIYVRNRSFIIIDLGIAFEDHRYFFCNLWLIRQNIVFHINGINAAHYSQFNYVRNPFEGMSIQK